MGYIVTGKLHVLLQRNLIICTIVMNREDRRREHPINKTIIDKSLFQMTALQLDSFKALGASAPAGTPAEVCFGGTGSQGAFQRVGRTGSSAGRG